MIEAVHDAQKGIISREDKKDLRDIVTALSSKRPTEEIGSVSAGGTGPAAENVADSSAANANVGSRMTPVPLASSPILKSGLGLRVQPSSLDAGHPETHGHSVEPGTQSDEEDSDFKHSTAKS